MSLHSDEGTFYINRVQAGLHIEKYTGHRVGYYFESLVEYWLKYIRRVEILAQGFQVLKEGRTMGEIDFIFRDEEGQIFHWEVAAKFYLYCEDRKVKGSQYIGPNEQDTFELKREKIFGRQLPLSETVFPEVHIREAFVKGRIYYHPDATVPDELPVGMRIDHLRGVWLRHSDLPWLDSEFSAKTSAYHLVGKPYWLSGECFKVSGSLPLSFRELIEYLARHFSESRNPVLTSVLFQDGNFWREGERVFVVADDWPDA